MIDTAQEARMDLVLVTLGEGVQTFKISGYLFADSRIRVNTTGGVGVLKSVERDNLEKFLTLEDIDGSVKIDFRWEGRVKRGFLTKASGSLWVSFS